MTVSQFCLGALVLLPLLAAAVSALLGERGRRFLGIVTALGVTAACVPVVVAVTGGTVVTLALGDYAAPLGIMLRADGLSALFLALTAVIGLLTTGYAAALPPPAGFWPLWSACWAGLNAVFVSGDLFNTYVGLELVGLSAVALVALGGRESWRPALRYLFVTVLGSMLFLVAVALIVSVTGTLDIAQAAEAIAADPNTHRIVVAALVLLSLGLAFKVALVPLHQWLVPAHSAAPSAVSPLLSALVIKASLFVLLRCWIWLAAPGLAPSLADAASGADPASAAAGAPDATALAMLTVVAWVLGGLGTLAILVGSVMALRQTRFKPLIAYSTVAQAGYWFLVFPILVDPASDTLEDQGVTTLVDDAVLAGAVSGTVALALGHGVAKAGMFLAAGFLKDVYGTDSISGLRGTAGRHPTLVMAIGLCGVGLAGLPISLGFTGKWQLSTAAVGAGHYWILPVVVIATLFSAAYVIRSVAPLLLVTGTAENDDASDDGDGTTGDGDASGDGDDTTAPLAAPRLGDPPFLAQLAPFALGTLTIVAGFLGAWTFGVLDVGAPW